MYNIILYKIFCWIDAYNSPHYFYQVWHDIPHNVYLGTYIQTEMFLKNRNTN